MARKYTRAASVSTAYLYVDQIILRGHIGTMPRPLIDLVGKRFGRLTVMHMAGQNKHGQHRWLCQCDCGGVSTVVGTSLRRGTTRSCGCLANGVELGKPAPRNALRTWRQTRRPPLTQTDLARRLGLSRSYVHRIETGSRQIGLDLLPLICRRTGLTPEELRPDLSRLMRMR
jgi:DNA-binding XRE family transcriptional regulator